MVVFCQIELSPNYLGNVYPSSQAHSTWMLDWHGSGSEVSSITLARLGFLPLDSQQVLVFLNAEMLNPFLHLCCCNLWILNLLYTQDGQGVNAIKIAVEPRAAFNSVLSVSGLITVNQTEIYFNSGLIQLFTWHHHQTKIWIVIKVKRKEIIGMSVFYDMLEMAKKNIAYRIRK